MIFYNIVQDLSINKKKYNKRNVLFERTAAKNVSWGRHSFLRGGLQTTPTRATVCLAKFPRGCEPCALNGFLYGSNVYSEKGKRSHRLPLEYFIIYQSFADTSVTCCKLVYWLFSIRNAVLSPCAAICSSYSRL